MRRSRRHSLSLLLLDGLTVFAVFNGVSWLRGVQPWGSMIDWPLLVPYLLLASCLYLIDGYRARTELMSLDYASLHVLANGAAFLGTLLLTYVLIPAHFPLQGSRTVIALSFAAIAFLTLSYRRSLYRWEESGRRDRCIVVCGEAESVHAFRALCVENRLHQPVVGASPQTIETGRSDATVRPLADVLAEVRDGRLAVEAVVLPEECPLEPADAERLVELYFAGVPTFTRELFFETYWRKVPLDRVRPTWLFQEGFQIARNRVFERVKRAFDATFATIALLLTAPILIVAAAVIKASDGGPILYRQPRVGRNRQVFTMLKLRTMRVGSDASDQPNYTGTDDPRVTRVGRLLRATRIDEIPQLWNVLSSEMSLIGPRAEWTRLVADYESQIPGYHFRHLVRPGITGWAQVNYRYGASVEDTRRKLEYDLFYIRHFSFRIDASIVLKTIHVMLFGKGR